MPQEERSFNSARLAPLQDSDSDEDASDSGACRARMAPAPRRPPPAKVGGGSDDESAAGPKPGEKVGACTTVLVVCSVTSVLSAAVRCSKLYLARCMRVELYCRSGCFEIHKFVRAVPCADYCDPSRLYLCNCYCLYYRACKATALVSWSCGAKQRICFASALRVVKRCARQQSCSRFEIA